MSVLDEITTMKSQGASNQEIIRNLQERGVPPREIQEALSQAQIKNAVQGEPVMEMEKSIMDQSPYSDSQYSMEAPDQSGSYAPEYTPQAPQENYPGQEGYSQEYSGYPQEYSQGYGQSPQDQQQYGYAQGADTGTLVEVAEQVFSDKSKRLQKQMEVLNEFRMLAETRLSNVEERLKRIEGMFDKLQISIIDRVGSYGKNLSSLQKEVDMMQDSFSKVVDPLLDEAHRKHRR